MTLDEYLQDCDERYSTAHQLLESRIPEGQYHCTLPVGSKAHHVRGSLCYAVVLLRADGGNEKHIDRAADIIEKVLSLQDSDPTSGRFGIWPLYLQEPLSEMAVPDFNYADFIGSQLFYVRREYADVITNELVSEIEAALLRAAMAIFRRNVGPGYTNIAFAGAAVTAAIGELLDRPEFVRYARKRFADIVEHTEYHGGINEYNSPGYTFVSLQWCEWTNEMVDDERVLELAEQLRAMVWEMYADHFHPGTGQLAGPHARAYSNWLGPNPVGQLRTRTGVEIESRMGEPAEEPDPSGLLNYVKPMACPEDIARRFEQLPETPVELSHCYIRREDEAMSTRGTTWMDDDACVGTVNDDNLWVQRHPLIAYWRTEDDPAVCFRLRFLHDGQDFASAHVINCQRGARVLSTVSLLTNKGDWHDHIDRPDVPGQFEAEDFRMRYELTGRNVSISHVDDRRFELSAGDYRAIVHTAFGQFGEHDVTWKIGHGREDDDEQVFVDAICYQGPRREFSFCDMSDIVLVGGVEILGADEEPAEAEIKIQRADAERLEANWSVGEGLSVTGPIRPHP